MISINDVGGILAAKTPVHGSDGKIGTVGQVFLDDSSNDPTWMTVNTGLFGTKETFVPLDGATYENDEIVVPFTKDAVKDAPRLDVDENLTPQQESELFEHYGLQDRYAGWDQQPGVAGDARQDGTAPVADQQGAPVAGAGHAGAPAEGGVAGPTFRDDRPDSARPDAPTADGRPVQADSDLAAPAAAAAGGAAAGGALAGPPHVGPGRVSEDGAPAGAHDERPVQAGAPVGDARLGDTPVQPRAGEHGGPAGAPAAPHEQGHAGAGEVDRPPHEREHGVPGEAPVPPHEREHGGPGEAPVPPHEREHGGPAGGPPVPPHEREHGVPGEAPVPPHAQGGAADQAGQPTGRMRLRRYTVTETFAEDGTPVTSEDIHIERDPAGPDAGADGDAGRHARP
ncbi:PRC-barrel domain-containing protein [Georgenia sp. Z1344]|uniref:PRC-barrel domain-containing protein n=1 Tax=Georgenia sp. Z1344 TaxID=3416706 RepID=UPI003CF58FA4